MSQYYSLDELVQASQLTDLKLAEEKHAKEKAERMALLAKSRVNGQLNISQLLEKLAPAVEAPPGAAAPVAPKPVERKDSDARFPPPPSSKQ